MNSTSLATFLQGIQHAALFLFVCVLVPGASRAQDVTVQNVSGPPVKISAADIAAMPHQTAPIDSHGKKIHYEGAPVRLLLEKAGVTFGETLHGKRLSSYLLVEAADGYRVVFALPEFDPAFTDRVILLADRVDGYALDSKEGPFRIIVPDEKRMARSARQVTSLKVLYTP